VVVFGAIIRINVVLSQYVFRKQFEVGGLVCILRVRVVLQFVFEHQFV